MLLRPGTDAFSLWSLLPVVGAAFYALAHVTTRVKCQQTPVSALALAQNFVMMLAGLIFSLVLLWIQPHGHLFQDNPYLFGLWSKIDWVDGLVLLLLAAFTLFISVLLAGAYQAAPPAIVSTFEYTYLIFVVIWDILFFGIAPTATSMTGMVLIALAGLLVITRQNGSPHPVDRDPVTHRRTAKSSISSRR